MVRLFGDWGMEGSEEDSTQWLEVASAAAFGVVGIQWAAKLLELGEQELGGDMLRAVEAAGDTVGLADSHEIMQWVTFFSTLVRSLLSPCFVKAHIN